MKTCKNCGMQYEGNCCPNCQSTEFVSLDNEPETKQIDNLVPPTIGQEERPSTFKFNRKLIRPIAEGIGAIAIISLIASSAGRVSKSDYDTLKKELSQTQTTLDELESEHSSLETANSDLQTEYDTLQTSYDSLNSDYTQYKEKMKPFEEMTAAQAEAEKLKAEQEKKAMEEAAAAQKAAEEAAAAQKAAEEEAARAAEEAKGYETGITYEQLARTPDDFKGKKIKFYGKVVQVLEGGSTVQIRLAVNDDYDTILFGEYLSSIVSSRILEDDEITIYGTSVGTVSYQSTLGGTITIPGVSIDRIDQ